MNKTHDPLFFIAVLPDEKIQKEVTAFKQECRQLFQVSHALKSPPHITLITPFRWPILRLPELRLSLLDFAFDQFSFSLDLDGFQCFAPRAIFVKPKFNETLNQLQSNLQEHLLKNIGLEQRQNHGFHPHMTIAHRDLKKEKFAVAWEHFSKKEYQRMFLVNALALLKHQNKRWEILEAMIFG